MPDGKQRQQLDQLLSSFARQPEVDTAFIMYTSTASFVIVEDCTVFCEPVITQNWPGLYQTKGLRSRTPIDCSNVCPAISSCMIAPTQCLAAAHTKALFEFAVHRAAGAV